jgi:Zn-dependent protease/CBS domain-containing protein
VSGLPVARLFGIEIRLALSWVFVIAIVTVTIGGQLRAIQPEAPELLAWVIGGMASLGFLVATVAHELGHALVARRVGLDVPVISVHFIGGPAVVDVRAPTPRGEAAVALAGPLVSVAIGGGAVLIAFAVAAFGLNSVVAELIADVAFLVGSLCLVLAAVSIIPAYPLDGGRLVRAIAWARTGSDRRGAKAAGTVGRGIGWILIGSGLAVILVGEAGNGVMIALIGWFLGASSRSVDRWLLLDALVSGVRVDEAMEPELDTIGPQLTLDTFGSQVLDGTLGPVLPVVRDDVLLGMIGSGQLRSVPQRDWPSTRTADVMIDAAELPSLRPDETLADGLERLRTSQLEGLPVLDGTKIRGMLTRRSIAVTLRARADLRGVSL